MSAWLDWTLITITGLGAVTLLAWRMGLGALVTGKQRRDAACGGCPKCGIVEQMNERLAGIK